MVTQESLPRSKSWMLQLDALQKAGCQKIFIDKVTGIKLLKPEFEKRLHYVREGDTVA